MTPGIRLVLGFVFWVAAALNLPGADAASDDPDKDPQLPKLLEEARTLIDTKKPQVAIEKCDKVIALFQERYARSTEKVYCAGSSAENLGYLMKAAAAMNDGTFEKGKKNAIVLSPTWASAHFMKGFALEEMGKLAEAKSAFKEALALSPWNSQYLSELAYLFALQKDWAQAKEHYQAAEEHAPLSPDNTRARDLARARRGLGYVFVELGQLDAAEKKYEECLATDKNDKKAAAELQYVRDLKAKR
jgi:tetratricopeptide (TPR) repeat protein